MALSACIWAASIALFLAGAACMVLRRQLLALILGLELMVNAANMNLVYYAIQWRDPSGLAIALFILVMAAAEIVVGFSLLLALNRSSGSCETQNIRSLAG